MHVYVTDALKLIAENAQKAAIPGVGVVDVGSVLTQRWAELLEPQKEAAPSRTGDERALDVMQRAGLHQKAGDKP